MGFDRKYGKVTTEHGGIPEDEPVIVFRGRDELVPELLAYYARLCQRAGSPDRHVAIVNRTMQAIEKWQRDNPDKVKMPDSERSRAWMEE